MELAAALLLGIVTPVAVILFRVRYQHNQHSILFAVARSGLYQNRPTNQSSCGRRALLEYLVKTYTNEGDIIADFTMGSGTAGVACKNLKRKFIGIEKDKDIFNTAVNRINEA